MTNPLLLALRTDLRIRSEKSDVASSEGSEANRPDDTSECLGKSRSSNPMIGQSKIQNLKKAKSIHRKLVLSAVEVSKILMRPDRVIR